MSKFSATIKKELAELIPPTVYFFIALHIVVIVRKLLLEGTGISVGTTASIALLALILGKAVLLADLTPFINRFADKPLAYGIAWKTAIYALMALLLHYVEHLVHAWRATGSFVAGNEKLLAEMVWPHFWAIQILLVVMTLIYCTSAECVRVVGGGKVRHVLFGTPLKPPAN